MLKNVDFCKLNIACIANVAAQEQKINIAGVVWPVRERLPANPTILKNAH